MAGGGSADRVGTLLSRQIRFLVIDRWGVDYLILCCPSCCLFSVLTNEVLPGLNLS